MPNNKHFLIIFNISISTKNIYKILIKKSLNDIFINQFENIKIINSLLPVVCNIEPKM